MVLDKQGSDFVTSTSYEKMQKSYSNRGHRRTFSRNVKDNLNSENDGRPHKQTITGWPGYTPTPLVILSQSPVIVVSRSYYKDESQRLDMKSFKALGGAYAVANLVEADGDGG